MAKFSGMGYLLSGALFAANAIGADLTLYADDDYQGRALGVVIDERTLGVLNFDKRASSVVVENNAWVLCTGEEYTGQCITLEPGRYASLQALGPMPPTSCCTPARTTSAHRTPWTGREPTCAWNLCRRRRPRP